MTRGTSINDPRRSLPRLPEEVGTTWQTERRRGVDRRGVVRPSPKAERAAFVVGDVMTRNARSCHPDSTLAAAALAMCEADCRFLPVVDGTGRPVGVITDGDVCLLGSTDRRPLRELTVQAVMSSPPATCRADDDILDAIRIMRERRIRHLPIVNPEGLLEGVVSLTDMVLCAEEEGSPRLRQELAATLRAIAQKRGDCRVIQHNPFVQD